MSKNYKFKKKIDDLFYGVYNYHEDAKRNYVGFSLESGFNAEKLFALSDLLGTAQIHTRPEAVAGGGCPTCDGDLTTWLAISASEVKF